MEEFPPLVPDVIEEGGATRLVGRRVQVWSTLGSTNDWVSRFANVRENEGLVVLAEEQSAGRGRQGRRWQSPRGSSILMSVLLFPPAELVQPEALVCLTAVSVAEALEGVVTRPVEIKWPNDLYLAGRKVGGILVERRQATIVGIGINVHAAPPPSQDVPRAGCLADAAAGPIDRSRIVQRVLAALDRQYARACAEGIGNVVTEWCKRVAFLGEVVEVQARGQSHSGTLLEIDPLSHLSLRMSRGEITRFPIHEVQCLNPWVGEER